MTNEQTDWQLELDGGKYRLIYYKTGGMVALRNGEVWRELTGDNLVYFLGIRIKELETMLGMVETDQGCFVKGMRSMMASAHKNAMNHGFWSERDELARIAAAASPGLGRFALCAIDALSIALKHSELSEALEAVRNGNPPDDKIPQHTGVAAEMADVVIRIMDFCQKRGIDLPTVILDKMDANSKRPQKHGGKEF